MQVLALQTDLDWESPGTNLAALRTRLAAMPPARGSFLVLPEMWSTGFSVGSTRVAEPAGGATEGALAALAAEHGIWILAGLAVEEAGVGRNQAVLFAPDGSTHPDRYTKLFPFTPSGEAAAFPPGGEVVLWEVGGLTVSPFICYDLRFPEPFYQAAAAGADTLVVIANFPSRRQAHWDLLLRARAIECQAFAVGVNRTGSDPHLDYLGGTTIADPWGEVLASVPPGETGFASADLTPAVVSSARSSFPPLADRRAAAGLPSPKLTQSDLVSP